MRRAGFVYLLSAALLLAACGSINNSSQNGGPPPTATLLTGSASGCPSATGPLSGPLAFISQNRLITVGADGADQREVLTLPPGQGITDPSWSPDGRTLAYTYSFPNPDESRPWLQQGKICGLDRASGESRLLAQSSDTVTVLEDPTWMPDGGGLLVTRHTYIFGEQNELLGEEIDVARYGLGQNSGATLVKNGRSAAISPDGSTLVFAQIDPAFYTMTLSLANSQGQNQRLLYAPDNVFTTVQDPFWSPDGKQIAFTMSDDQPQPGGSAGESLSLLDRLLGVEVASAHGVPANIWLVTPDGQTKTRLTAQGIDDPRVAWSPDAKSLAFTSGLGGVTVLDLAGGQQRKIADLGDYGGISWASS